MASLSISSESDGSTGAINKQPKRGDHSAAGDYAICDIVESVLPDKLRSFDEDKLSGLGSLCVTRIEQIRQKVADYRVNSVVNLEDVN